MHRRFSYALCATLLAVSLPGRAVEGPEIVELGSHAAPATVITPDRMGRTLKLRTGDGRVMTVAVPPAVRNFDHVEAGEQISLDYLETFAMVVRKAFGTRPDIAGGGPMAGAKAAAPGTRSGVGLRSADVVAVVTDIDHAGHRLTLNIPNRGTQAFKVSDAMAHFAELRKGDQVVLQHMAAVALTLTR